SADALGRVVDRALGPLPTTLRHVAPGGGSGARALHPDPSTGPGVARRKRSTRAATAGDETMAEHDQRASTDRGSAQQTSAGDHEAEARRADRTAGTTATAPIDDDASAERPAERLQHDVCE